VDGVVDPFDDGERDAGGAPVVALAQAVGDRLQPGPEPATDPAAERAGACQDRGHHRWPAPVGYHRTVFRQRLRPQLVKTGHRYAIAGLVLLPLALVGAMQLAASFVLGAWASILAAVLAGLCATLWFVIPLFQRLRHRPPTRDADLTATG
jgi:Family of unknown function (DUF6328)